MKKYIKIFFFFSVFIFSVAARNPDIFCYKNISICVTKQDITQLPVDAIVNAANKELPTHPGGVAGAIWKAAGSGDLNKFVKNNFPFKAGVRINLGQSVITPSFALKKFGINHIIHTVGPDCRINEPLEKLYDAYKNSLLLANKYKLESIAFPAISTGIFGGDKKECARLAVKAIFDNAPQTNLKEIYLTIYDDEYLNYIKQNLNKKI